MDSVEYNCIILDRDNNVITNGKVAYDAFRQSAPIYIIGENNPPYNKKTYVNGTIQAQGLVLNGIYNLMIERDGYKLFIKDILIIYNIQDLYQFTADNIKVERI